MFLMEKQRPGFASNLYRRHVSRVLAVILYLAVLLVRQGIAEEIHYQGTHILTYSTMDKLATAFKEKTGKVVSVRGGGCADGVVGVVNGRFEMGGLCCPAKPKEIEEYGLVPHPVARDIKVVIVNRENPLDSLSVDQLRAIHKGMISGWRELGWLDKPVAVIYRTHCLDRKEPVRMFLGIDSRLGNLAPKAIRVRTDTEVIDYVKRFPTAIGITSKVFVGNREVKILKIDGVEPTARNVMSGRYSFTAVLYIVTRSEPDETTGEFLDFVRSSEGQAIISENLAGMP